MITAKTIPVIALAACLLATGVTTSAMAQTTSKAEEEIVQPDFQTRLQHAMSYRHPSRKTYANMEKEQPEAWAKPFRGENCGANMEGKAARENPGFENPMRKGTVTTVCQNGVWRVRCSSSFSEDQIGCVMPDDTIFAGISPANRKRMFVTKEDQGVRSWNSGHGVVENIELDDCSSEDLKARGCYTGEENTKLLASKGRAEYPAPYYAALRCYDLTDNGHDDWILPAINELMVIGKHYKVIGGFDVTDMGGRFYWSSSERGINSALALGIFEDNIYKPGGANASNFVKDQKASVRCIRYQ